MLTPQPRKEITMLPPVTVAFSTIVQGGVFGYTGSYWEKLDDGSAVDLIAGSRSTAFTGTEQVLSFPDASLSLG
jgi:hypothetical protein